MSALNISLDSPTVIFSTTFEYSTSSSSIVSNEFLTGLFHLTRGWLVGTNNAIRSSCNR